MMSAARVPARRSFERAVIEGRNPESVRIYKGKALPIYGWFGCRNSGDEAFRDAHSLLLPDVDLTWCQAGRPVMFRPEREIRDDVAIVGGGDVVSPEYFADMAYPPGSGDGLFR